MSRPYDVVAYAYGADLWCPTHIEEIALGKIEEHHDQQPWEGVDASTEQLLDHWASLEGLDRQDEATFDSSDFPKVVFRDMLDSNERCGHCGAVLDA